MANSVSLSAKISFIVFLILCPYLSLAISSCNGRCETFDDCSGQLICIDGRCKDDPAAGNRVCPGGRSRRSPRPSPANGFCKPTGTLQCDGESESQPTFDCSPPVSSSTKALLTNNDFSKGGDGGGASECDGAFHDNSERVVALSTGWFNGGSLCGKTIRIRAKNGRSTTAKVVDECDSLHGCDDDHDGQPPCRNNIVDGSNAVWDALGLDIDVGGRIGYLVGGLGQLLEQILVNKYLCRVFNS